MYVRHYVACSSNCYGHRKGKMVFLFLVIGFDAALNNITVHIVDTEMQANKIKFGRLSKYKIIRTAVNNSNC